MIGTTVFHGTTLEMPGGGGTGVVCKARDPRLARPVALKFPPFGLTRDPEAKRRFLHEPRAASALDHQSIRVALEPRLRAALLISKGSFEIRHSPNWIRHTELPASAFRSSW